MSSSSVAARGRAVILVVPHPAAGRAGSGDRIACYAPECEWADHSGRAGTRKPNWLAVCVIDLSRSRTRPRPLIRNEPEKRWVVTCFMALSHASFDEAVANDHKAAGRRIAEAEKERRGQEP